MMRTLLNPVSDLRQLDDWFDRLFEIPRTAPTNVFPIDVVEMADHVVVRAAAPGMKPEELDLQVQDGVLTLRGEHKWSDEYKDGKVYRREQTYGTFTRAIRLPDNLDLNKVEALFENGIVNIRIPKMEHFEPKPLQVPIRKA